MEKNIRINEKNIEDKLKTYLDGWVNKYFKSVYSYILYYSYFKLFYLREEIHTATTLVRKKHQLFFPGAGVTK